MCRPFTFLHLIALIMCSHLCASVPAQKSSNLKAQLSPYYLKVMTAHRKLAHKMSREELRAITTIGILNGAKEAEQRMEQNLIALVRDLLFNTDMSDKNFALPKIEKIEKQLERDQKALEILANSIEMATDSKDVGTFEVKPLNISKSLRRPMQINTTSENSYSEIGHRVAQLRKQILKQIHLMKSVVEDKINYALEYLIDHAADNGPLAKAGQNGLRKRQVQVSETPRMAPIKSLLTEDDFRNNLVEIPLTVNEDDAFKDDNLLQAVHNDVKTNSTKGVNGTVAAVANTSRTAYAKDMHPAKQENGSPELLDNDDQPPGGGGGGLVGIITGLSGGEGGSDIGALIGALTGVISQIFGPGGLDIETLISSATALISGLLAGDRNFGTVLGIYVGTAFDGLSGGGGAINNGQFIGNFLGTVVASLSADPEEENVPPKPFVFLKSLTSSFVEAKNRILSDEESAERNDTGSSDTKVGSDSAAFIKHVVSHVVGGIVSLILNTALGASGGASQTSQSAFAGSSAGHKPSPDALTL